MSGSLKILPADRKPHRHEKDCFCSGGSLPVSMFAAVGYELRPNQLAAGLGAREAAAYLGAREAAAYLSGEGLASEFYYRGQAELCSWLSGFVGGWLAQFEAGK